MPNKKVSLFSVCFLFSFLILVSLGVWAQTSAVVAQNNDTQIFLPLLQNESCRRPYVDDFSDPTSGWLVEEDDETIHRYFNGEYNIFHKSEDQWTASSRGDDWQNSKLVQIDGKIIGGVGVWGLTFGANGDSNQIYGFYILPHDKRFSLLRYRDDTDWENVTHEVRSEILTGDQFNTISISRTNETMHLNINGVEVYTMAQIEGEVGVSGTSNFTESADIRFDNYIFVDENCPLTNGSRAADHELDALESGPSIELLLGE